MLEEFVRQASSWCECLDGRRHVNRGRGGTLIRNEKSDAIYVKHAFSSKFRLHCNNSVGCSAEGRHWRTAEETLCSGTGAMVLFRCRCVAGVSGRVNAVRPRASCLVLEDVWSMRPQAVLSRTIRPANPPLLDISWVELNRRGPPRSSSRNLTLRGKRLSRSSANIFERDRARDRVEATCNRTEAKRSTAQQHSRPYVIRHDHLVRTLSKRRATRGRLNSPGSDSPCLFLLHLLLFPLDCLLYRRRPRRRLCPVEDPRYFRMVP